MYFFTVDEKEHIQLHNKSQDKVHWISHQIIIVISKYNKIAICIALHCDCRDKSWQFWVDEELVGDPMVTWIQKDAKSDIFDTFYSF